MYFPFPLYPILVYDATLLQPIVPDAAFRPVNPHSLFDGSVNLQLDQSHRPACIPYERQQYQKVDPTIFCQSAESFEQLMDNGHKLLEKLSESSSFAEQVMDAAQKSDKEKVKQLMGSTDIQGSITTEFNPDSITINLASDDEQKNCCKLSMELRWR